MAEELVERMETFVLSSKDKEGSQLDINDMVDVIQECKLSIIGKVWGEKLTNFIENKFFF